MDEIDSYIAFWQHCCMKILVAKVHTFGWEKNFYDHVKYLKVQGAFFDLKAPKKFFLAPVKINFSNA